MDNMFSRMAQSRNIFKTHLKTNGEFSHVIWSGDGRCASFKMQSDSGVYNVNAQFILYEDELKLILETGIHCADPYYIQMISYLAFASQALGTNTKYTINENGMVLTTYTLSFYSFYIKRDEFLKAFCHLKCSIDYCVEDIKKIACGNPVFDYEFVQSRIDGRMERELVDSLKKTIAEIKNNSTGVQEDDEIDSEKY